MALSGGATPRAAHRLLSREPLRRAFPWKSTYVFWVDERCVPEDDPASNYGNARLDLLDRVPIPRENVFPMPAMLPPDQGAREYASLLARFFDLPPGGLPRFDLILLGLGADGHIASLFAGDPALGETSRLATSVKGGVPMVARLTLTLPVLNVSGHNIFAVSGRSKADAVRAVLEEGDDRLPGSLVSGRQTWLLDAEAAAGLTENFGPGPAAQGGES
jgi:6-phosphogluconolactonase